MLTSVVAEPLLTGLGAGGYMLIAAPGQADVLLDFFVAVPSDGERAPLVPVDVSFGDAMQVFNIGAASCGVYGAPAGVHAAHGRYGSIPLAELPAPAPALPPAPREGNEQPRARLEARPPATARSAGSRARWLPKRPPNAAAPVDREPARA